MPRRGASVLSALKAAGVDISRVEYRPTQRGDYFAVPINAIKPVPKKAATKRKPKVSRRTPILT